MSPRSVVQFIALLLCVTQLPFAAIRTVSKGSDGQYKTITAALNDAQEGDEIVIVDFETYS